MGNGTRRHPRTKKDARLDASTSLIVSADALSTTTEVLQEVDSLLKLGQLGKVKKVVKVAREATKIASAALKRDVVNVSHENSSLLKSVTNSISVADHRNQQFKRPLEKKNPCDIKLDELRKYCAKKKKYFHQKRNYAPSLKAMKTETLSESCDTMDHQQNLVSSQLKLHRRQRMGISTALLRW